jgi:hypothetical protein
MNLNGMGKLGAAAKLQLKYVNGYPCINATLGKDCGIRQDRRSHLPLGSARRGLLTALPSIPMIT